MADPDEEDGHAEDRQQLQDVLKVLGGLSIGDVLQAGWEASLRLLVAKVSTGQASHQELAILRNLLRDNGMVMNKVLEGTTAKPLPLPSDDIPMLGRPEYT